MLWQKLIKVVDTIIRSFSIRKRVLAVFSPIVRDMMLSIYFSYQKILYFAFSWHKLLFNREKNFYQFLFSLSLSLYRSYTLTLSLTHTTHNTLSLSHSFTTPSISIYLFLSLLCIYLTLSPNVLQKMCENILLHWTPGRVVVVVVKLEILWNN